MQATGQFNRQITTILHGLQTAFFYYNHYSKG